MANEIRIKKLTEFTFAEMEDMWNRGFEGYMVDISMPLERLLARFAFDGLSPELSVVACIDEAPVGFVFSGLRTIGGKRVAWNGGTGVATEHRRHGVGQRLIEASLDMYRQHGADSAVLEAIDANVKAIRLYEKMGYQTVDRLAFYQHRGDYSRERMLGAQSAACTLCRGLPADVSGLTFYNHRAAWQTQWQNAIGGESVIAQNNSGETIGYALFKRVYDADGQLASIVLYQCEVQPGCEEPESVVRYLLSEVYGATDESCRRGTVNLSANNTVVNAVLQATGFSVQLEQVHMVRPMEGR